MQQSIVYTNGPKQWPPEQWDQYEKGPPDEERCQHEMYGQMRCGLPAYSTDGEGRPVCIFHATKSRDPDRLREELENAVARKARLWRVNLAGVNLRRMDLTDTHMPRADLQGATLANTRLENADMYAANLREADLRGAKIELKTDLRRADLTGARLAWAEIDTSVKLDGVTWAEEGIVLQDERVGQNRASPEEQLELLRECTAVYRQIKQNYQDAGDYQQAGDFFLREMECKRACMNISTPSHPAAPLLTRLVWWLMYHTCGYGEHPFRIAKISALLVLLFALLHGLAGIRAPSGEYVVGPGLTWPPSLEGVYAFFRAVYFSTVTFTSLGYGDLQPGPALGKALASIEVVIGVFCMSLFLVTITRRWSR